MERGSMLREPEPKYVLLIFFENILPPKIQLECTGSIPFGQKEKEFNGKGRDQ